MVIDGRFELLERLGAGGMGTVWRAKDLALHREVALKEVRFTDPEAESNPEVARMLRERVMREARALARLDHPNVVTVHHIIDGPDMTHPWIVMELVRGQSLEARLQQGTLPPADAAAIGRGVLGALNCAHQAGICHRDVKPGNVLLRHDGRPVLTDFGIAALRDWTRVTATGGLVGSPAYIAPERLHGEEGNPASDLWSLGMLLYVAVEGHNPMHRATTAATLAAVLKGEVPPPQRAGPLTPVLTALLTPRPADRPDAVRLDQMLAQAAVGASVPSDPGYPIGPVTPVNPADLGTSPSADGTTTGPGTRPLPTPGTTQGALPGTTTMEPEPRAPAGRRPRWGGWVAAAMTLVMVTAMVGVVYVLPRFVSAMVPQGPGAIPTSGFPRLGGGTGPFGLPGTSSTNLLTPSGIKDVIKALEKVSGSTEFTKFIVYKEYAIAEAPVRGKRNLYDKYSFRNGRATRDGAGGTLSAGAGRVKLRSLNWDALPALMRRAERTLKVPKPTMRYVVVEPAWTFNNKKPTMMVYLVDDYGGAYLAADRNGKVVSTHPRD